MDDISSLHLYHHVMNASESLKSLKLPGLPSVGDILEKSSSIEEMANFQIPGLPPLKDILNTDNIKAIRKTLDKLSLEKVNSTVVDVDKQDRKDDELKSSLRSAFTVDEYDESDITTSEPEPPTTTEQFSLLPDISGLFNPAVDIDNLMAVTKIVPHLIPFIVRDYKEKIAGWLEGTEVGQDELAEIHSTLVDWHNKIGKELQTF